MHGVRVFEIDDQLADLDGTGPADLENVEMVRSTVRPDMGKKIAPAIDSLLNILRKHARQLAR